MVVLGERLAPLTMLGIALAIVAIVLVSQQEAAAGPVAVRAWALPPGVGLALPSGVAIGLFFLALAETDAQAGMWPLVAARAVSVTLFGARPWRMAAPVTRIAIAAGAIDMGTNALYLCGRAAAIVEEAGGHPSGLAGGAPPSPSERLHPPDRPIAGT